jgi:hypothetical protein
MKFLKTMLVISLLSVGLAAHAGGRDDDEHEGGGGCGGGGSGTTCNNIINLDFASPGWVTGLSPSWDVSMSGYDFTVTGSVSNNKSGREFNDVVWSQYGFGIDSTKDKASDLVNEYEIIKFTFTAPTSVSLVGARFLDKKGNSIDGDDDQYEYSVDGGRWTSRNFDSDGFRDLESGTEFAFRYADDDGKSFWVSGLDVCAPVAPIPEPETYALMIAGLGLVGFMARRRKVMRGASA